MKKVVYILSRLGVAVQAWEEGLGGDEENLPSRFSTWNHSSLTLNAWNTGKLVPFTFANAGYKVVECFTVFNAEYKVVQYLTASMQNTR